MARGKSGAYSYTTRAKSAIGGQAFSFGWWGYVSARAVNVISSVIWAGSGAAIFMNCRSDGTLQFGTNTAGVSVFSTDTYSANTWFHALGVQSASNNRTLYVNGVNQGTSTVDDGINVSAYDRVLLQAVQASRSAYIAAPCIWNVGLSDAEAAVLGKGFSPHFIRPQNLISYPPLVRSHADIISGIDASPSGALDVFPHPPIIGAIAA